MGKKGILLRKPIAHGVRAFTTASVNARLLPAMPPMSPAAAQAAGAALPLPGPPQPLCRAHPMDRQTDSWQQDTGELSGKQGSVCLPSQLKLEMIPCISYEDKGEERVVSRSPGEMYVGVRLFKALQRAGLAGARSTSRLLRVPRLPLSPPRAPAARRGRGWSWVPGTGSAKR